MRIKKVLLAALCAAAVGGTLPLAAAKVEYKNRSLEAKLAEPGVRFLASFDKRHINSDKAQGYKKALSHSGISLDLRGAMGFDDNPAYIPAADEELAYLLKNNLDIKNGALSFWFRCDDFDPGHLEGLLQSASQVLFRPIQANEQFCSIRRG